MRVAVAHSGRLPRNERSEAVAPRGRGLELLVAEQRVRRWADAFWLAGAAVAAVGEQVLAMLERERGGAYDLRATRGACEHER